MSTEPMDLARVADALEALRREVSRLSERVQVLEARTGLPAPAAAPAAAAPPVASANTPASSGIVVSMTAEARKRPMALCGVTSPYPTVVAVVIAQ